jgi:hypothetical protein
LGWAGNMVEDYRKSIPSPFYLTWSGYKVKEYTTSIFSPFYLTWAGNKVKEYTTSILLNFLGESYQTTISVYNPAIDNVISCYIFVTGQRKFLSTFSIFSGFPVSGSH